MQNCHRQRASHNHGSQKAFAKSIEDLCYVLEACDDDCSNLHYQRMVDIEVCNEDSDNIDDEDDCDYFNFCDIQGHPLSCHTGKECHSQLVTLCGLS